MVTIYKAIWPKYIIQFVLVKQLSKLSFEKNYEIECSLIELKEI